MVAAAVEQNHDANGIIWPVSIAPFHAAFVPINYKDKPTRDVVDRLYQDLQENGIDVLLDDRDERPGVKFKDADLIGIPLRVTIGAKGLEKGFIELRRRQTGKTEEIPLAESVKKLQAILMARRCRHSHGDPSSSWCANAAPCASG